MVRRNIMIIVHCSAIVALTQSIPPIHMTPAKTAASIQVITRAVRLLETMASHDEPVSLKRLAQATQLHPSTAFRILTSLREHGFVERGEGGRYGLGAKLAQLAARRPLPASVPPPVRLPVIPDRRAS